jgi:hypothetical protein
MIINLVNKSIPISDEIEKYIIKIINKKPYYSYSKINNDELDNIYNTILQKYNIDNLNKNIILSIRASYVKNHMINNHKNINYNKKKIIMDYNNNINILEISTRYDISPLNLLRYIFSSKYSKKLTYLIKHKNILNKFDLIQLDLAIDNDIYALVDNSVVLTESINYELDIQKFLDKHDIKYKTQDQLVEEQIKLYGRPISTPDFLIKSNLFIDNKKINWIDAKNYYGANISFIKKSINKQILKYNKNYGYGCIIFKLGFNDSLKFNNTLLLDNKIIES